VGTTIRVWDRENQQQLTMDVSDWHPNDVEVLRQKLSAENYTDFEVRVDSAETVRQMAESAKGGVYDGLVSAPVQDLDLDAWTGALDLLNRSGDSNNVREYVGSLQRNGVGARIAANAANSAAINRAEFFAQENKRIDAELRVGENATADRRVASSSAYNTQVGELNLESFANQRAYSAESAALSLQDVTGRAAFNQSQLDNDLTGLGLDTADFRRGESVTADPYRALEADQTGAASGQRRYAQDVRAAAAASAEKKILLAEQRIAQTKADSDRALMVALEGISSGQRNADRTFLLQSRIAQATQTRNTELAAEKAEEKAGEIDRFNRGAQLEADQTGEPRYSWDNILLYPATTPHDVEVTNVSAAADVLPVLPVWTASDPDPVETVAPVAPPVNTAFAELNSNPGNPPLTGFQAQGLAAAKPQAFAQIGGLR